MSGSYSGRDPRKFLCVFLAFIIGFSFAINFIEPKDVYADSPSVSYDGYDNWGDGVNFEVKLSDFEEGAETTISISFPHKIEGGYSIWSPGSCQVELSDEYTLEVAFTYFSGA